MILSRLRLVIVVLLAIGCASRKGAVSKPPDLPQARLVRVAAMEVTRSSTRPRLDVDITYEIVIKPDGSPDFNTLKILGKGAFEIRNALSEWLGASLFEAARVNGVPVMSIFKGGLRSSVRVM